MDEHISEGYSDWRKLYTGGTTCSDKPVKLPDMEMLDRIMKKICVTPVPVEIRMGLKALGVIEKHFQTAEPSNYMYGLKVIVIDTDEFAENQGKIIYNDGSSKVIDIYKRVEPIE